MIRTFVIGDIHGCRKTFDRLLERCEFDPKSDRLWLVGDLVNRGPDSLRMLRRARKLHRKMGSRFRMVLGNHDIHLLARADGIRRPRAKDTLDELLAAPDAPELLAWLRRRKLAHFEDGYLMVHAGLLPEWDLKTSLKAASKLRKRLGSGKKLPNREPRSLRILTRIRMVDPRRGLSTFSGPPEEAPSKLVSWFDAWSRAAAKTDDPITVLFGHWAALGQRSGGKKRRRWISLDSGCVYGRHLTALRLPDQKIIQQRSKF